MTLLRLFEHAVQIIHYSFSLPFHIQCFRSRTEAPASRREAPVFDLQSLLPPPLKDVVGSGKHIDARSHHSPCKCSPLKKYGHFISAELHNLTYVETVLYLAVDFQDAIISRAVPEVPSVPIDVSQPIPDVTAAPAASSVSSSDRGICHFLNSS